jgi:hypothetical protein
MYWVKGGIFETTEFENVCDGTEECYGPFETLEEAEEAWKRATFTSKLDICTHRLKIERDAEIDPDLLLRAKKLAGYLYDNKGQTYDQLWDSLPFTKKYWTFKVLGDVS